MWLVSVSVMLAVVQCASSAGGSPRLPTRRTPPRFWASATPTTVARASAVASARAVRIGRWRLRLMGSSRGRICGGGGGLSRARGWLELEILVRRGVGKALDPVDAGLLDARPDAPEEGQLVDRHVHHPVVHDLLDLV